MRSRPSAHVFLAATLAATSAAFGFGGDNNAMQTAGTVTPPDQATDTGSLTPTSGVNGFGMPAQFATPSTGESPGGQGMPQWPSQPRESWNPSEGGSPQMGWPSNAGGDQDWGALEPDCSGSGQGGWTPSSGDQDWGPLEPDCSGSGVGGWGGQGWGALEVDCSGSNGVGWSPPSGGQGWGAPSIDCSGSGGGFSLAGSDAVESPQEAAPSTAGSAGTAAPVASSRDADQGASLSSSTATLSVGADADQKSLLRSSATQTSSSDSESGQQQQDPGSYTSASGSDAIAYTSTWGAPVVAETGTNYTSADPTFGKVTSKAGECVVGEPTEYISTEYLDWVWEHRIGPNADTSNKANWNVMANKNFLMDKFVHNKGSINYCVRWDTDNTLSKEVASEFQGVLERHYDAWNKWLEGYNCWPFKQLKVNMVGWAAKDAAQFEWSDDAMGTIYEGVLDPTDGVPQCPNECYRFFDNVNNVWSDTSACQGEPYDVSFWLKEDIPYGFGYDWGQEVSLNNTMENLHDRNVMFIGHEIGHGFGLPDFYGLEDKPAKDFPNSIMMAYSSTTITPSDGWMLRRVLDHVRARYKF